MIVRFEIPGIPRGKQRPRMTRSGHAYTPKETVNYENLVKLCYMDADGRRFDDVPLYVCIYAYYESPKSVSKKKRQQMINGEIRPTKTPDCDNLAKAICDALNGIAYRDDSAITTLYVQKWYGEEPKVVVHILQDFEVKEKDEYDTERGRFMPPTEV